MRSRDYWKHNARSIRSESLQSTLPGTAASAGEKRLSEEPEFGPPASSMEEFLDRARPDVVIELTTLNAVTGEPAITHIRKAFERNAHVVTANKGPIAVAFHDLCAQRGRRCRVPLRVDVHGWPPVFNMVRNNLPGVQILGFTGVLNSTTKIAIAAMQRGLSMATGIAEAQSLGVAEADASNDIDGWDSAAKTAALANVLMDARITPRDVERTGIGHLTPEYVQSLAANGKTVCLVSRAENGQFLVRPEEVEHNSLLAGVTGTSNLLLLHTDLMGTVGTVSISPGVDQTAYGVFSDVVDIARSL